MDNRDDSMHKIPKDRTIISVCNRGNASDEIVEILRDQGYDAYSIRDGMKSWGSVYNTDYILDSERAKVVQVNRLAKGCLSYILISAGDAAIIDASRHIKQYLEFLKENDLRLKFVFDTHLHADHISGGEALAHITGAEYYINEHDISGGKLKFNRLEDGIDFTLGEVPIRAIGLHTPGHTPGSSSLLFDEKYLFTGDIIFLSSMGRPDLGGHASKWVKDLWKTVRRLEKLPDSTVVLPAHSSGISEFDEKGRVHATLGELRSRNHLLTIKDEASFEKEILSSLPEQPESYAEMRKVNMGLDKPDEEQMSELELGKNQCAVEAYQEGKKG
jgi:glyoxylase-like metal-dependent hydrolase (beta-lactamase superfamily II)